MIKKLNNKGLTIIELLVCFVLVALVTIPLINTIMEYKNMQQTEHIKNLIINYKNEVTQAIQKDIIVKSLTNAEVVESTDKYIKISLKFKNTFDNNIDTKNLIVYSDNNNNYIEYPDIVNGTVQPIRYKLPRTSQIYDATSENLDDKDKFNDIHFRNLPIPLDGDSSFISNEIFHLYIPIDHSEIDGTYAIDIVAPTIP